MSEAIWFDSTTMLLERFTVILSRPSQPENIGAVARSMKNTGFRHLRIVMDSPLDPAAYVTAVHAEEILDTARIFSNLDEAVQDLDMIFAATAKPRKNFPLLSWPEAETKMLGFPIEIRIGLLFGNERTGLTSAELRRTNFRFQIPQAVRQPSYNLAAAVLLTLFSLFRLGQAEPKLVASTRPLPRREQEECIRLVIEKLLEKGFIQHGNRKHVTEMIYDLFGRLSMTAKDRNLILALFAKGPDFLEPEE